MYQIPNWSSYQSYKDRKPLWLRLHVSIIDNYEFQMLSEPAQALLPQLWILASEHPDPTCGIIKYDLKQICFRLRKKESQICNSLNELESSNFINKLQICNESVTPETETETETETENTKEKPKFELPSWMPLPAWEDYVAYRKEVKKPMTRRAAELSLMKLEKLKNQGEDVAAVINQTIERSYTGLFPVSLDGKNKAAKFPKINQSKVLVV